MITNEIPEHLYPFKSHYLHIDDLRYHYVDEGQGHPILMIHGNPTWSFYFRNLIRDLSPHYRCIAPDHIGLGLSSKPEEDEYQFRLVDRVDNLDKLVESLEIKDNITLVLHDWGGMIGLAWARRHPERIKRLIILNTSGFHLPEQKSLPPSLRFCRNTRLGGALVMGLNGFTRCANHFCVTKTKMAPEVKAAYLAPHPKMRDRRAILKFVQDIPLRPADASYNLVSETQARLKHFRKTPTLILWGAKDFVFDDRFLREWQEHLPHAEVHRFPDAGHYILEDAYPECIRFIQDFLARNSLKGSLDS